MLKKVFPLTVLGLFLLGAEQSFGVQEPPAPARAERLFQRCDANRDGVLDPKEFAEAMKLIAKERARQTKEGRPEARPEPRPDERSMPPEIRGPGPAGDLDPRIVEAVHRVLRQMTPEMRERIEQILQEREGRMRGEFRDGFERTMRERQERAPQFICGVVEDVLMEHRGDIQRMIDESVQRALRAEPGRSGMRHPANERAEMRESGKDRREMREPGRGRREMPAGPPRPEGDEFRGDYPPPPLAPERRRMGQRRGDAPPPPAVEKQRFDERSAPPAQSEGARRDNRPGKGAGRFRRWAGLRWMRDGAPWAALRDKAESQFGPRFWKQWQQRKFAGGGQGQAVMRPQRFAVLRRMATARVRHLIRRFHLTYDDISMRYGLSSGPQKFGWVNRERAGRFDRPK